MSATLRRNGVGPRVVLVGPSGAGKTTVGHALAALWNCQFRDTDEDIETATGEQIPAIITTHGEVEFRRRERQAVQQGLADHEGVLCLGGGAIVDPATRAELLGHPVVFLDVQAETALQRLRASHDRPLLQGDPQGRWSELYEQRRNWYEEVMTVVVDTTNLTPEQTAEAVAHALTPQQQPPPPARVQVGRAGQAHPPYEVVIGHAVVESAPGVESFAEQAIGQQAVRVAVICPAAADSHCAAVSGCASPSPLHRIVSTVVNHLRSTGRQVEVIGVADGEAAKSPQVATQCWSALARAGFTRSDAVVGIGGGSITDLAGFVAATWLRGVRAVLIPTSLLAMVDAAVGGKTGINLPEGKNLVGAFAPPHGVWCDLSALDTLPHAELISGMAEVVKAGLLADPVIIELLENSFENSFPNNFSNSFSGVTHSRWQPDRSTLAHLIERAIRVKATIVTDDLTERTTQAHAVVGREALNYGHTLGHAIETCSNYTWRHGEAVAVGMVFAAELAGLLKLISPEVVQRHRHIISRLGLPVSYRDAHWDQLRTVIAVDKKVRGHSQRWILLQEQPAAPAGAVASLSPTVVADIADEVLVEAFHRISR